MDEQIPPAPHQEPPPVADVLQDVEDQQLQQNPPPNGANLHDGAKDAKDDLDAFLRVEVRFAPLRSDIADLEAKRDTAKISLWRQQQALSTAVDSQNETRAQTESYAGSVEALGDGIEAEKRDVAALEKRRGEKFKELGRVRAELAAAREDSRRQRAGGDGGTLNKRPKGGGGSRVDDVDRVEALQEGFQSIVTAITDFDAAIREQKKTVEESEKTRVFFQEAGEKLQTKGETLGLRVGNKRRAVEGGEKRVEDLNEKIAEKRNVVDEEKLAERVAEQRAKQKKIRLTLRNLAGDRVWRTEDLFGSMLEQMPTHQWDWNDNDMIRHYIDAAVSLTPLLAIPTPVHWFLRGCGLPQLVLRGGSSADGVRVPPEFLSLTSTVTATVFDLFESLADFWRAIQKECEYQQEIGDDDAGLSDDEEDGDLLNINNSQQRVGLRFITRHAPTIEFDATLPKAHLVLDEKGQGPVLRIASWGQVFSWSQSDQVDAGIGRGYPPGWSNLRCCSLDVCIRSDAEQFGGPPKEIHRTWMRIEDDVPGPTPTPPQLELHKMCPSHQNFMCFPNRQSCGREREGGSGNRGAASKDYLDTVAREGDSRRHDDIGERDHEKETRN